MNAETRIYGVGTPGARPCLWPDEAAPCDGSDWDDPYLCRRRATKLVAFKGATGGITSCAACAERELAAHPGEIIVLPFSEAAS